MERLRADAAGVARAAELIRAGEVVAFPTDTVYGLAALPGSAHRIYAAKSRPADKQLIAMAADPAQLEALVEVGEEARSLMERHWPGALTLVLPARSGTAPTLGVRVPDHALALALLRAIGQPVLTTSANLAGEPPAMTAGEVRLPGVAAVLDGGPAPGGAPSTVAALVGGELRVIRPGPVAPRGYPMAMASGTQQALTFKALDRQDPEIADLIRQEYRRQSRTLELIPSENLASPAILEALGTLLTNKYAEGYPGRRFYGGCEVVDEIEKLAIERARRLFAAEFVNVQPHAGSQANAAAYMAVCQPGDKVMGLDLGCGGHLTHGSPVNFSGKLYEIHSYAVDRSSGLIDYDAVQKEAEAVRPRMLLVGYSAYPRVIDFARMRQIADSVGAVMVTDMAHFAGLVAGGAHASPIPHSHIVTTTTQKTLRGAWGGMIFSATEEWAKKIDSAVFPGTQGGPLMHAIAAKAVCFQEALKPEFKQYARQVVANAAALAARLQERGLQLVSGGTDNHLMLIDLRPLGMRGRPVQDAADTVGITMNKNAIPFDEAPPFNPSGMRLGSPSVTTRGMGEAEMGEIGDCIADLLEGVEDAANRDRIRERTLDLCRRFPIPYAYE